jgi:hypothetical protein
MKNTLKLAVLLAIALIMVLGCTKKSEPQTKTGTAQYNYDKILKEDLSDFAGTWANGRGVTSELTSSGIFGRGYNAYGFKKTGDSYLWNVSKDGDSMEVTLYPIGTELVNADNQTIQTDITKVRIAVNFVSASDEVYYQGSGTAAVQPQTPTTAVQTPTASPIEDFEIDGTTLVKYIGKGGHVTIPDGVIHIGYRAFYEKQLTSVTIPNSVTGIGQQAFFENKLTSVTIGNSVASIGDSAFATNQLTSVIIPDGVTSIGGWSFGGNKLTSVTIGNNVVSIDDGAFCENLLASVTIPNSVTEIGSQAFYANKLTSVTIGNRVASIGNYAFALNKLTSITIPASITEIGTEAFAGNQLNGNFTVPDNNRVEIGYNAFGDELLTIE